MGVAQRWPGDRCALGVVSPFVGGAGGGGAFRLRLHWEALDEEVSVAGLLAGRGDATGGAGEAA